MMSLILTDGRPILNASGATLVMEAACKKQIVYITVEALREMASPPHSDMDRLMQYLTEFSHIAGQKFDIGRIEGDGCVWVTSADVVNWRRLHGL